MRYRQLLLLSMLLGAVGSAERLFGADAPLQPPTDDQKTWAVGFSVFTTSDLPVEFEYLAASVPQLLLSDLHELPEHTFSPEERTAYQSSILRTAVTKAQGALDTLVKARDQIVFSQATGSSREQQYASSDAQIADARKRLAYLSSLKPDSVAVAQTKPIVLAVDTSTGRLFPSPDERPAVLADAQKLDAVVYGSISYQAGVAYVDVYVYNRALNKVVYHRDYPQSPERLYDWIPFAADELAGELLGRPWGSVSVSVNPSSAAIRVDGNLVGFGSATARYLAPGTHLITVSESGYRDVTRDVDLAPSKTEQVQLVLSVQNRGHAIIRSTPGGADVYIGSIWSGVTPLTVPLPDEPEEVRLSLKGYLDSHFLLSPAGPESVERTLVTSAIDFPKIIQARRDEFYTHIGWFLLAVPVPIILNGLFSNEMAVAQNTSEFASLTPAAQNQVITSGNVFYYAAWGTAFLAAGLFVNAMISLVEYIQAGEEYHIR